MAAKTGRPTLPVSGSLLACCVAGKPAQAIGNIQREIEAAGRTSPKSRLLVPITQAPGAPSLQFKVELKSLDKLEAFRGHGVGSKGAIAKWTQAFSATSLFAPAVEILRVEAS